MNIFKVFYLLQKSLKLRKVSPQAIVTKLLIPPWCPLTASVGGFTHNPAFLAVREFKMAGSVELLDLAETEGASRKRTEAMEFSPQVTQFFNVVGFMGFLKVNRRFLEHFWRNSGKIFRPFFGIYVARPTVNKLWYKWNCACDKLPSVGAFSRKNGHVVNHDVFSAFYFHEHSGSKQENRIVCLLFGFNRFCCRCYSNFVRFRVKRWLKLFDGKLTFCNATYQIYMYSPAH